MPMVLAMNGAEFGELGASYSSAVASLQNALVTLGKGIGDPTLMKIVVDGIMGPKTAAAANRALTVHLGSGQAPSNLRSGSLPQATITSMASQITALLSAEIARRGFAAPSAVKAPAKKAAARPATAAFVPSAAPEQLAPAAASPVYRVPAAAASADSTDLSSVMKWAAIGVGVVALGGVAYYFATRKKSGGGGGLRARTGVPGGALRGFGAARRRGAYKGKRSAFDVTTWEERDRLHIGVTKNGDPIDLDWWDDDARGMIEDGFFKAGRDLKKSVLDYAEENGLIQFTGARGQ